MLGLCLLLCRPICSVYVRLVVRNHEELAKSSAGASRVSSRPFSLSLSLSLIFFSLYFFFSLSLSHNFLFNLCVCFFSFSQSLPHLPLSSSLPLFPFFSSFFLSFFLSFSLSLFLHHFLSFQRLSLYHLVTNHDCS